MQRTEQQVAADDQLEHAIRTCAEAYGFGADAEFIGDWLVVAEMPQLDRDAHETPYAVLWSGAGLPRHRSEGLVKVAQNALDAALDDDED